MEWISIKDEMPDKMRRVIAFSPAMEESDTGGISVQWGWMCHNPKTDFTHWMPLPEPPSENN